MKQESILRHAGTRILGLVPTLLVLITLAFFLILGFPVAIFLAWAYELTPQGVRRDADARQSREESEQEPSTATAASGWRYPVFVVLLVAIGFFAFRWPGDRHPGDVNAVAIAAANELVSQDRFGEASFVNMSMFLSSRMNSYA